MATTGSDFNPQQTLALADIVHTAQAVETAITRLSLDVSAKIADTNPIVICVMNGGLVFAGQVLKQLSFPLQVDYIHASRYQNKKVGDDLSWYAMPRSDLTNRTVLLLDDILDQGVTLHAIREKCLALGAKKVFSAVLVEKKLTRKSLMVVDFVGLEVPNRYVFGYGMDIHGWWRNLPAIYAI
ncbi:MAG: hypoxanthine-guanine phosphoribosyltransferase [Methylophilaceae bacterium]